jgi:hypothetical protein
MQYVFIVGAPFSGSTALGNLLNNLRPGLYAGELNRFPQFAEFYPGPPVTSGCEACAAAGRECPEWGTAAVAPLASLSAPALLATVAARAGHGVLVEGSKDPNFLATVGDALGDQDVRALIVHRDPLRCMASYMEAERREFNRRCEPWMAAEFWRNSHVNTLRVINRLGIPSMVFDSALLRPGVQGALNPAVRRVFHFCGLDHLWDEAVAMPAEQRFAPTHQFGGNQGVQAGRSQGPASAAILANEGRAMADALAFTPGAVDLGHYLGWTMLDILRARK